MTRGALLAVRRRFLITIAAVLVQFLGLVPAIAATAASSAASATLTSAGSSFFPAGPVRLMDTRSGTGGTTGPVAAGATVTLQVAGVGGVPSSGVTSVVLNLTAVSPSGSGFLEAYPDGTTAPTVSDVSFGGGLNTANMITVPLGADGKVAIFVGGGGSVQILADLAGYFSDSATGGSIFFPAGPVRLMDTRSGTGGTTGPVAAGATVTLQVAGTSGVPSSGVTSVVLNLTAVSPSGSGFLEAYPDGTTAPTVSDVSFGGGLNAANMITVPLGADGKVAIFVGGGGSVHILADLAGYYSAAAGSAFFPAGPVRLMDTRTGTGGTTGPVAAGTTVTLQVAGVSGVPSSGVTSVVLNLTAVSPSGSGFLEAYPDGTTAPTVSDVSFGGGLNTANMVTVPLGADGKVAIFVGGGGSVQVLADLAGYYNGAPDARPMA